VVWALELTAHGGSRGDVEVRELGQKRRDLAEPVLLGELLDARELIGDLDEADVAAAALEIVSGARQAVRRVRARGGVQLRCSGCVIADVWMCNCRTVVSVANRTAKPKAASKVSRRNRGLMLRSVFQSPPIPKMGVPP